MKRLLLTILLGVSFCGFSQETDPKEVKAVETVEEQDNSVFTFQGVKYGVRGGYNISNLDFDGSPTMENKHRNSIFIGFFGEIGLSKVFSIVPEIQFSAEGASAELLHLDYIQAPIFLRFRLSEKIHAGLGPQVGLKVHKYEDGIRNFAYSGVAGVEYKISYMLFADLRYTYGFSNIFDENLGITAKNTNIQIGVGYKF
jgi:hypothetical protein